MAKPTSRTNGSVPINDNNSTLRTSRARIIFGKSTHISQAPWQVLIQSPNMNCGGSILSDLFVVTAAHCFPGYIIPSAIKIIYGTSYTKNDGTDTFVRAAQVKNHPRYKNIMNGLDISLVMLAQRLPLEPGRVAPIKLANGPPPDGKFCRISGFGYTQPGSEIMSRQLQSAENTIMDKRLCAKTWPNNLNGPTASLVMKELIFCSQTNRYASRTCQGDSGGPFLCAHRDGYYLHGLVSFGDGIDCTKNAFTNVVPFTNWLRQTSKLMRRQHYG